MSSVEIFRKLCVSDIASSTTDESKEVFYCLISEKDNIQPLIYKNVRICGLVAAVSKPEFTIDDGTGSIQILAMQDDVEFIPKCGEYAEVFGTVENQNGPRIRMKTVKVKTDPNEEVRHLLEISCIHSHYFQFQFLPDESSQQSAASQSNQTAEMIFGMISNSDPDKGVTIDQIKAACEGSEDVPAHLNALVANGMIYERGGAYFPK